MQTVEYLVHGHVNVVDVLGDDRSVVRAARVSYGGHNDSVPFDTVRDSKLLKYLLRNEHWSPFEHASMTFRVKAPIFIARQWMRHRSWSFNEVSARYKELPHEVWCPSSWRTQGKDNKQVSGDIIREWETTKSLDFSLDDTILMAFSTYDFLLEKGVAREQARAVLPVGTYTEFYATANLRSIFHFIQLRDHEHAQPEIQRYAQDVRAAAAEHFPHSFAALEGDDG